MSKQAVYRIGSSDPYGQIVQHPHDMSTDPNSPAMSSLSPISSAPRLSLDSTSPPPRNPSLRLSHMPQMPSAAAQHRQSFNELRGAPPSPRSQRQPSISHLAVQELINNPPQRTAQDPKFAGRDWRTINVQELTSPDDLRFVEASTGVEAATNVCLPWVRILRKY